MPIGWQAISSIVDSLLYGGEMTSHLEWRTDHNRFRRQVRKQLFQKYIADKTLAKHSLMLHVV